mmetsp:Transcript_57518/g.106224  ORF Transcript_57518/g.106224 Transcript_57518/m.106224 type:complete len:190 (-) Transcript_57518:43-612(-)
MPPRKQAGTAGDGEGRKRRVDAVAISAEEEELWRDLSESYSMKGEWTRGETHPIDDGRYMQTEQFMSPKENLFCPRCQAMYNWQQMDFKKLCLVCADCGYTHQLKENAVLQAKVTVIERRDPPWWLLQSERFLQGGESEGKQYAEIEQECPGCGATKLQFWTRQLRSADEGQTVFTLCKKCGWRGMEHS